MIGESVRNLAIWTEFMRKGTRPEFLSDSGPTSALTQELAWLAPRKGLRPLEASRRHRALRCAGYHYLGTYTEWLTG